MSINDITGDKIMTKVISNTYRDNYGKIFGNKYNSNMDEYKEKCPYCGILTDNPCDSPPPDICEQAINVTYGDPTK